MVGRVRFALFTFVSLLALMAFRAFDLQVLASEDILSRAYRKFDHTVKLSPQRGSILDINGEPLAISLEVKSVAANPGLIEDPSREAARIARELKLDRAALTRRLRSKKGFVWIKRHATPNEVDALRALKIKGLAFFPEAKRFYPESESLANVLGIVGIDGEGLEGIELYYDRLLTGKARHVQMQRDGLGRTIYARGLSPQEAEDGCSLTMTLDRRVQYIAACELNQTIREHNARSGFVIITRPATGEVLAMATAPSFDPNRGSYRHLSGHKNRAVIDVFEPGSVIKPLWVGWGLDRGSFTSSQSFFCENGRLTFHRVTIHDHDREGYGWLPVRDIVKYSSNIGMVKLMEASSSHDMHSALKSFCLGVPTGIDYPGEPAGLIRAPQKWTSVDKAAISFGQGFAVTGIQLITSFNALVNGGLVMRPRLVHHITAADGSEVQAFEPVVARKVISRKTSQELLGILKGVVLKDGTAETAAMTDYQTFGKTGTAQKVDPLTGGYSKNAYISSFMGGIIDASGRPVLTMIVCIDEPHPQYYASVVACPLFKRIAIKCVNVLDIRPILTVAKKEGRG